jgi:hypothetical protein
MRRQRLYVNDRGDLVMHVGGFSWLAAFALPLWALRHRMYVLAVLAVVLSNAIALAGNGIQAAAFVTQFLLFGSTASRLHRWFLERRGWRVTAQEPQPPARGA